MTRQDSPLFRMTRQAARCPTPTAITRPKLCISHRAESLTNLSDCMALTLLNELDDDNTSPNSLPSACSRDKLADSVGRTLWLRQGIRGLASDQIITTCCSMWAWCEPVLDFLSIPDHYSRSKRMPAHRAHNELSNRLFAPLASLRYNLPLLTETHGYCQY